MILRWIVFGALELALAFIAWSKYSVNDYLGAGVFVFIFIALALLFVRKMPYNMHGVITLFEKPWVYVKPGLYIIIPIAEKIIRVTKKPIVRDLKATKVVTGEGIEKVQVPDTNNPGESIEKDQYVGFLEMDLDYTFTISYPTGKKLVAAIPFLPTKEKNFSDDINTVILAGVVNFANSSVWYKLLKAEEFSKEVLEYVLSQTASASVIKKYQIGEDELFIKIKNPDLPPEAEVAQLSVEIARLKAIAAIAIAQSDTTIIDNLAKRFGDNENGKNKAAQVMVARALGNRELLIDPTRLMTEEVKKSEE